MERRDKVIQECERVLIMATIQRRMAPIIEKHLLATPEPTISLPTFPFVP